MRFRSGGGRAAKRGGKRIGDGSGSRTRLRLWSRGHHGLRLKFLHANEALFIVPLLLPLLKGISRFPVKKERRKSLVTKDAGKGKGVVFAAILRKQGEEKGREHYKYKEAATNRSKVIFCIPIQMLQERLLGGHLLPMDSPWARHVVALARFETAVRPDRFVVECSGLLLTQT